MEWLAAHTLSPYTVGLPSGGAASPLAFEDTRFQVTREVARGGMGRILAAVDRRLGRPVAIKVALTNDLLTQQRIGREAAILSSLSHDALPPIYELGPLRGGLAPRAPPCGGWTGGGGRAGGSRTSCRGSWMATGSTSGCARRPRRGRRCCRSW